MKNVFVNLPNNHVIPKEEYSSYIEVGPLGRIQKAE